MSTDRLKAAEALARGATRCRDCFDRDEVRPAHIDVAQPRWIGEHYWKAKRRIVVLMCNPGEGLSYPEALEQTLRHLQQFREGQLSLAEVFKGQSRSKWARFYLDGLALDPDRVAFVNLAWCATKGNRYPRTVLDRCCSRHTMPLLRILQPHVVLAAGGKVQAVLRGLGTTHDLGAVVPILHHAHRKGRRAEILEFATIRRQLADHEATTSTAG